MSTSGFIRLFGQAILIPSPESPPSNPQEPLVATITDDDQEGREQRWRRRRRRRAMTLPSHLCMLQAYNASSSQFNTSLPFILRERKKGKPLTIIPFILPLMFTIDFMCSLLVLPCMVFGK